MVTPDARARARADVPLLIVAATATTVLALGASQLPADVGAMAIRVVLLAVVVGAVLAVTALRPVAAVYLYVATLPFLAGIDRSTLLPLVRPNEAVLALVLTGAVAGGIVRALRSGTVPRPVLHPVDLPLAAFVLLATVWPVASEMLRGLAPTGADLASTLPVPKLAALYVLVRVTVRHRTQVERLTRLVIWPAVAVAVIAVLQTLQFGPVLAVLRVWWSSAQDAPSDLAERGTTTLGSPLATGDVLVIAAVVLACCVVRGLLGRRERVVAAALLLTGILATGQVTAWISALVAAGFLVVAFPQLRRRARRAVVPAALLVAAVGVPAVLARAQDTASSGVPISWLTRWDNLSSFYLPALGDFHFALGVRPNPVLPAPETWREVIYLESGYLELLWVGGIPLLLGFVWLSWAVLRTAQEGASRPDARGALTQALGICWWTLVVVSVLDAHLTLRGTGDLLFVLLGVAVGVARSGARSTAPWFPGLRRTRQVGTIGPLPARS
ncbi:hypothetical protein [Actinomycetospora sp. TBRC 11914]|uniref:hypothetical protein n=1 Tax=Actinomycetospora sp. TBRC 11914 TaxID=2729387 RepID=UPI00145D1FA5|nr:hypothetical protein [Actinomycetospora sp. TBRC 11914]NMO88385.1 hypothetical protein [Actinomycetospora sp. TBRC 11914]